MHRNLSILILLLMIALASCSSSNDDEDNNGNVDLDSDLIVNNIDNCPTIFNPNQAATIGNSLLLGDVCDDEDTDTIADAFDNCPLVGNGDQLDTDGNGVGDACGSCGIASMVADIKQGEDNSWPITLQAVAGKLYLIAPNSDFGTTLLQYDTANSAMGVTPVGGRLGSIEINNFRDSLLLDGKLYFAADDGEHGVELWVFNPDDDATGTQLLADINPGSDGSGPHNFTELDGKLYFAANDGVLGSELWMYDPASPIDGAVMVADINPTSRGSSLRQFASLDGNLYFNANDGSTGAALWVYQPSLGASLLTHDLFKTETVPLGTLTAFAGKLYMIGFDSDDGISKLWVYDPANPSAGFTLAAIVPGQFFDHMPDDLTVFNGKLYFTASESNSYGSELWMFDPANSTAGTTIAADIWPGSWGSRPPLDDFDRSDFDLPLTEFNGELYFNAANGVAGYELVAFSDTGPTAGARLVADINPGAEESFPTHMIPLDNKLYFRASDGVHGYELWEYDPACAE